jgi:hypothetical protein
MQAAGWLGFAAGIGLLLLTMSSVVKMLLIPRNLTSVIGTAVARSVLAAYRLITTCTGGNRSSPAGPRPSSLR